MKRITIIGGGASGTLTAVNLLRNSGEGPLTISLIEKRTEIGRGVAYSTDHDLHFLNVPAGKMSAFPDDPDNFHQWLLSNGFDYAASDFVPRKLYGRYLRELLDDAFANASPNAVINIINDEPENIVFEGDTANVILRSGEKIASDKVVLAFGNFPPPHPSVPDLRFTEQPKYIRNVWEKDVLSVTDKDDAVLVIGTGLSMVDVALRLNDSGHKGPIYVISTRGLVPSVHKLGFNYEQFNDTLLKFERITDVLKEVRKHSVASSDQDSDWRAVIDSIRPATQQLWIGLPIAEKRYFMQHLSRHWNSARHRMPPQVAERLEKNEDGRRF
ncbi:MAG: FAD/NAD(P)-binding protein [Acidobacteria bacterium]|nr:FAD/NAD(P)-binding protein [Acidobacteriota bacterium]